MQHDIDVISFVTYKPRYRNIISEGFYDLFIVNIKLNLNSRIYIYIYALDKLVMSEQEMKKIQWSIRITDMITEIVIKGFRHGQ